MPSRKWKVAIDIAGGCRRASTRHAQNAAQRMAGSAGTSGARRWTQRFAPARRLFHPKLHGAQATGCSPISTAHKAGLDFFKPVKPDTIAKSLAIGTPADGFYALKVMNDTGGAAEDVTDEEIREGIKLLVETEGIFAETAGGVTVSVARKLIVSGKIPREDLAVLCHWQRPRNPGCGERPLWHATGNQTEFA